MARVLMLLVLLLTGVQTTTAQTATERRPGLLHFYQMAAQAIGEDDHLSAVTHLSQGLNTHPTSPHLHLFMARTRLALGDTAACLRSLERLAALGGVLDLTGYPPLGPIAADPAFAAVARALQPVPPTPARVTTELGESDLWTEGIAWNGRTGELFAGSVKLGKLVRVLDGEVQDLGTSAQDTLLEIIGLDVDARRGHLWAVMGLDRREEGEPHDFGERPRDNGIVAYDLKTGALLLDHRLDAGAILYRMGEAEPDSVIHMWNDVSVAPDGTAYFTDMSAGLVWRLQPGGEPEVFHSCSLVEHVNGLAVSDDGSKLYVAGLEDIIVIDLDEGKQARLLEHGTDLCCGLGDGMALGDRDLFLVQNNGLLGQRILHLLLTADGYGVEKSEALHAGLPDGLMSYTCALGDGVLYVNGTAPFADYESPETPAMPVIVEIPYGLH